MLAGRVRYKTSGQLCSAAVPAAHAGETPALQGGRPGCQVPGCTRHPQRQQHRRQTTISLEGNTHSYLSESRGGPGPTWLSEGGREGGGGGKIEDEGVGPPECSPPARQRRAAGEVERGRRALALGGRGGRGRVPAVKDRGRRADSASDSGLLLPDLDPFVWWHVHPVSLLDVERLLELGHVRQGAVHPEPRR